MNTIEVNHKNDIPKDARVGDIYEIATELLKWKVCRNWCGTVFATQIDLSGHVFDEGKEIILRQDW